METTLQRSHIEIKKKRKKESLGKKHLPLIYEVYQTFSVPHDLAFVFQVIATLDLWAARISIPKIFLTLHCTQEVISQIKGYRVSTDRDKKYNKKDQLQESKECILACMHSLHHLVVTPLFQFQEWMIVAQQAPDRQKKHKNTRQIV